MSFYSELAADADALLAELGQPVTFSRSAVAGYDAGAGQSVTESYEWSGTAVMQPASQGVIESFDNRFDRATMIESNMVAMIISAKIERQPMPADKVYFGGHSWSLLGVTPLNVAGIPLIYQATAKR